VGRDITQQVFATYAQAQKQGKVFRLSFSAELNSYFIERFELPKPPPSEDNEEAFKKWQEKQKEKEKAEEAMSPEELRDRTSLDLGEFIRVKENKLPEGFKLKQLLKWNEEGVPEPKEAQIQSLLFYPTGEMDAGLIIIEDDAGRALSLTTDPLSGRVKAHSGVLTQEEWKSLLQEG